MSANLSALAKSFDVPLRDLVRELRRGYQSISECLEQTTAECDVRTAELSDCQRQLADAQQIIVDQEQQLARLADAQTTESNRCAGLKEQLEAKQWEIDQTIERLRLAEAEDAQSKEWLQGQIDQNRQIHTEVERMRSDNERSRNELAELHGQLAALTEKAMSAAELRGQLSAAHEELARLREQPANGPADADLLEQLAAANAKAQQFETALTQQQAQLAAMTDAAVSAAELRGHLTAAQEELARLREQAAHFGDSDLAEQLAAAHAQRQQLEATLAGQQAQLATLTDSAVSAAELRGQLTAAHEELERLRQEPRNNSVDPELHADLAVARAEKERLEATLAHAQGQVTALTESAIDAAELRGQLTAAQEELARLREQVADSSADTSLLEQLSIAKAERQQFEAALAQQQTQLVSLTEAATSAAELRGQLTAVQEELTRVREHSTDSPPSSDLVEQLAVANARTQQLEATLAQQQAQLATLADAAVSAAELRGQLTAARDELARLRNHSSDGPSDAELLAELAAAKADRQQLEGALAQQQAQVTALADAATTAAEVRGQLIAAHKELVRLRRQGASGVAETELREQLAAMASERERLEGILTALHGQLATLSDTATSAAEFRGQVAAFEARLAQINEQSPSSLVDAELRGQLAAAQAEIARLHELDSAATGADAALQIELASAKSQRQQLENELDLVRQRTAELAEMLDDQKRSIAAERQHWNEELRQLRRAVERQSELVVRRARRTASNDARDPAGATNSGGQHADPVIDTLREQFEALQRNKSRDANGASHKDTVEAKSYRVV